MTPSSQLSALAAGLCQDAVASLGADPALKLIGIGLGPETGHMKDYYPNSVANVPAARFAAEIAELLRRILNG